MLQENGISYDRVDGLRVTTPEVLQIARKTLMQVNSTIVNAIEDRGLPFFASDNLANPTNPISLSNPR